MKIFSSSNTLRKPDKIVIRCENGNTDCKAEIKEKGNNLELFVTADSSFPEFIDLYWYFETDNEVKVLGDTFERTYSDTEFGPLSVNRPLPWYFMVSENGACTCMGVKTGTGSFVGFTCSGEGVRACVDVRNGQHGVHLNGRTLCAAEFTAAKYTGMSEFSALKAFCKTLCDNPLSPAEPVYGGNNWYYAYGNSSREEILSDARLQSELAEGLPVRPFMVLDDGWQINSCAGPWEPSARYGDMKSLAEEFNRMGVKAGLWVRFLYDSSLSLPADCHFAGERSQPLDPSDERVLMHIREDIRKFKEWGFELLKHDFSTFDIFKKWGPQFGISPSYDKNCKTEFRDNTRTTAEIILNLYKTIKEEAGDMIVIGCNTVSHLTAGLAELNRTGDDTSGREFTPTREHGVNTLAFRLCQHKAFYDIDADCIGILKDNIPWELNSQWLDLLAESGTPLFVSCPYESADEQKRKDLRKAYEKACRQLTGAEPVDFTYNRTPNIWKTPNGIKKYKWTVE